MIIKNARIFTEDLELWQGDLRIEGTTIAEIGSNLSGGDVLDAGGLMLLPGFVDIHSHGCMGYDACDGDPEGYQKMCDFYASKGVTSILFTTMTLPTSRLEEIFTGIGRYCDQPHSGAVPRGIYVEGPFLNYARRGAQAGEHIIAPDLKLLEHLDRLSGNRAKVVAIAPEVEGAMDFISQASKRYTITLAHTDADYDTAAAAADHGATLITHLYNAMISPVHRAPGVPGAAFDKGMYCEIICDGLHIHPSMVRSAFRSAAPHRMVLVSDSMRAAGMPDGDYELGGQPVYVKAGKATLANGTLAGSSTNLLDCLRNVISWGIPFGQAVEAATRNPAAAARIDHLVGSITPGKQADLLLMDDNLNLKAVFIGGKQWEGATL